MGGGGSVYRVREDAIHIVLRCDKVCNLRGKSYFQKTDGFP